MITDPIFTALTYDFLVSKIHIITAVILFLDRTHLPPAGRLITITELVIYPLKSAKGIQVKKAELSSLGFKYDRQWYVFTSPEPLI